MSSLFFLTNLSRYLFVLSFQIINFWLWLINSVEYLFSRSLIPALILISPPHPLFFLLIFSSNFLSGIRGSLSVSLSYGSGVLWNTCPSSASPFLPWINHPSARKNEKQGQACSWFSCSFPQEAAHPTLFWRTQSSWGAAGGMFQNQTRPSGSYIITGDGTPRQWGLAASPSCPYRQTCVSANLLSQARRQRCSGKDRKEPKQWTQPSCQLTLLSLPLGISLLFELLLILIPGSFPPWHHSAGNPKTTIMEREHRKRLRNLPILLSAKEETKAQVTLIQVHSAVRAFFQLSVYTNHLCPGHCIRLWTWHFRYYPVTPAFTLSSCAVYAFAWPQIFKRLYDNAT